jgi:hypothetical protein
MGPLVRLFFIFTFASFAGFSFAATDRVSDLQGRFDHETNSVRKAKLFEKLGDAEFEQSRAASAANDYSTVDQVMEKYRDNARSAFEALKRQHPDAERQVGGYKQLQMHVHRALREIDEELLLAPDDLKPPLQLVRHDLVSMDNDLLNRLFPRRPEKNAPSPPSPEKQL